MTFILNLLIFFRDEFQSIHSSNFNKTKANIIWTENWVPFLDSIFQFNAFARDYDGVSTPSQIENLTIDVRRHNESKIITSEGLTCVNVDLYSLYEYTKSVTTEIKYNIILNVFLFDDCD